ncbi:hypothetical protein C0J52_14324 [Blattella germanica]|nr:hypothetical protein C0J52_14324 [Blattella germanica]
MECKKITFRDCKTADLRLKITKCKALILNVLAPHFVDRILNDIGDKKFSIIIDESTDIAVSKLLAVCIPAAEARTLIMLVLSVVVFFGYSRGIFIVILSGSVFMKFIDLCYQCNANIITKHINIKYVQNANELEVVLTGAVDGTDSDQDDAPSDNEENATAWKRRAGRKWSPIVIKMTKPNENNHIDMEAGEEQKSNDSVEYNSDSRSEPVASRSRASAGKRVSCLPHQEEGSSIAQESIENAIHPHRLSQRKFSKGVDYVYENSISISQFCGNGWYYTNQP